MHEYRDSLNFNFLKANFVTKYIINPKEFKQILSKIKLSDSEKAELKKNVQIQYDWGLNKKNKDIEKLFIGIYKRDQLERKIMTDCYMKTKNSDSCSHTNNLYKKMLYSDSINKFLIDSIAKTYGFPKRKWLGKGRGGFSTFIHHHRSIFEKNYDLFLFAALNNYFSESKFKTLVDFKLLDECKNQRYNMVYCGSSTLCTPCLYNKKCCEKEKDSNF